MFSHSIKYVCSLKYLLKEDEQIVTHLFNILLFLMHIGTCMEISEIFW